MLHKRNNFVERRLYEYALHAVCSPLQVLEPEITNDQLAAHVAKLFNVDQDEHEKKYMPVIMKQACRATLLVDIKKARNLLGEDQNGLSDPYCEVGVPCKTNNIEEVHRTNIIETPPSSPDLNRPRSSSLFSCAGSPSGKSKSKSSTSLQRKQGSQRGSIGCSQTLTTDKYRALSTHIRRTKIKPKTIDPEWNEHFEFEIENINEQCLKITVFDSDIGEELGMKTVVQEKRGFKHKILGMRKLLTTKQIEDDFLGQVIIDIKSLPLLEGERWVPLSDLDHSHSDITKPRGEILLGLKLHFKLDEEIKWITDALYINSPAISKDDKKSRDRKRISNDVVLEFRRRHSALEWNDPSRGSIISHPSIFRRNFRQPSLQSRDYTKTNPFEEDLQTKSGRTDAFLTPATDSDSPLLIEEYHQLFRIIVLHELEDAREMRKDLTNNVVIDWNGSKNPLSDSILVQFRVLYNIPVLSETLIQLLVIMELRCSQDYASCISQGVIDGYLKQLMDAVRQKNDTNDLDFTDYEKTVFKDIFYRFIGHYTQRVHMDAPWFLPSEEYLPNVKSIFNTIHALSQLKICSYQYLIKAYLQETIEARLKSDINLSFSANSFEFNDENDIQLNEIIDFVEFVRKLNRSMLTIQEYQRLFGLFNVNYLKICFYEKGSAADRLSDLVKYLLKYTTEYFRAFSKPMVRGTSSIYDPNLIQNSKPLLRLYTYIRNIVESIQNHLETQNCETEELKLELVNYHKWFSPAMKYLLESFVVLIRQVMERAIEGDYTDVASDDDPAFRFKSAGAIIRVCMELCREWDGLDYQDPNIRFTGMIKLTNTICEQSQHYARRIARKLSENEYFRDRDRSKPFHISTGLCVLVNDIEYVKKNVLSSLPNLLNFSNVIAKMIENFPLDNFKQTEVTLERLIQTAEREMNDVIKIIFERVVDLVGETLRTKIVIYYEDLKSSKPNDMDDVNEYIAVVLKNLKDRLEEALYSRVAFGIRIKVLKCLRELLPSKEPPEFYPRISQSFDQLVENLDFVCGEQLEIPGPACNEIIIFRQKLETYALTNEQLQLTYFRKLCLAASRHDYSSSNGEIMFRAASEIVDDLVRIHVQVVSCRNLPKMDMIGLSDPYVVLELLPTSFYNKPVRVYTTKVKKNTLNPEYNEFFKWDGLPMNVLHERGAVLRLSVWDKDFVNADFIGECFISLTNIQSMKNLATLRDVPVSEIHLRIPYKNMQPQVFELIRDRATFDKQAAAFLKQRLDVMEVGNPNDTTSILSDDRSSSGLHPQQQNLSNSKTSSYDSLQLFNSSGGYQLWNLVNWKGGSSNTSINTSEENYS